MSWTKIHTAVNLACARVPFSGVLTIYCDAWDAYAGYHGKLEYYFITSDTGSAFVVYRQLGSEDDSCVVRSKLFLTTAPTKWGFECRQSYWSPPLDARGKPKVAESVHEWNVLSFTLALFDFAEEFGRYHVLIKNCETFRNRLVKKMKESGPTYAQAAEKLGVIHDCRPGNYDLVKVLNKHLASRNYKVAIEFAPSNPTKENGEKGP